MAATMRTWRHVASDQPRGSRNTRKRTKHTKALDPNRFVSFVIFVSFVGALKRCKYCQLLHFLSRNSCVVVLQRADAEALLPQPADGADRGGGAGERGDA